jgi:hypothetical protein
MTAGGRSLTDQAQRYTDELMAHSEAPDPVSRRHHYVPRTYLRAWSFDRRRIWALDTVTSHVRPLGLADVCVKEDFYRVVGPGGEAHNRVELLFGVVDRELRRVQNLLTGLSDPEELTFDDLLGLSVTMAVQRMRTLQQRRLRRQQNAWLVAQNPKDFQPIHDDLQHPYRLSGFHTEVMFNGMWQAADVLTTRQIEIWEDPQGRFTTCDAPVFTPFVRGVRPALYAAPYVIWPISPHRVVVMSNHLVGEKAVISTATGKQVGMVREGVEQGRERMIFASAEQHDRLPAGKRFPAADPDAVSLLGHRPKRGASPKRWLRGRDGRRLRTRARRSPLFERPAPRGTRVGPSRLAG